MTSSWLDTLRDSNSRPNPKTIPNLDVIKISPVRYDITNLTDGKLVLAVSAKTGMEAAYGRPSEFDIHTINYIRTVTDSAGKSGALMEVKISNVETVHILVIAADLEKPSAKRFQVIDEKTQARHAVLHAARQALANASAPVATPALPQPRRP